MASGDLAVQDNRIMSQLSDHRVSPQPSDSPQIIPGDLRTSWIRVSNADRVCSPNQCTPLVCWVVDSHLAPTLRSAEACHSPELAPLPLPMQYTQPLHYTQLEFGPLRERALMCLFSNH